MGKNMINVVMPKNPWLVHEKWFLSFFDTQNYIILLQDTKNVNTHS